MYGFRLRNPAPPPHLARLIRGAGIVIAVAAACVAAYWSGLVTAGDQSRVPVGMSEVTGPVVHADQLRLGDQFETGRLRHQFSIENPTDHPLPITGLRSTCDCAVLSPDGSFTIPPHESRSVEVALTLRMASACSRRRGENEPTRIPVAVSFRDAGGEERERVWAIECNIRPHLRLVAGATRLGLRSVERPSVPNLVFAASEQVERIECAGSASWQVVVGTGRPTVAGREYEASLVWRGPGQPTSFEEPITLMPVGPDGPLPELTLNLSGELAPDILSFPRAVLFGRTLAGKPVEDAVLVRSLSGKRLRRVVATGPAVPGFTATANPATPEGVVVRVRLAAVPAGEQGYSVGLSAETEDGRVMAFDLPVRCVGVP